MQLHANARLVPSTRLLLLRRVLEKLPGLPARSYRPPSGRLPIPQLGGKYPDSFYERFAQIYAQLVRAGMPAPAATIAEANTVPITTVHRWAKEARAGSYWPPVGEESPSKPERGIEQMASIQDRRKQDRGWRVQYRDPDGKMRSRSFPKWADADAFANNVETDKLRGEYQDPRAGYALLKDWAAHWFTMTTPTLKPSTVES